MKNVIGQSLLSVYTGITENRSGVKKLSVYLNVDAAKAANVAYPYISVEYKDGLRAFYADRNRDGFVDKQSTAGLGESQTLTDDNYNKLVDTETYSKS